MIYKYLKVSNILGAKFSHSHYQIVYLMNMVNKFKDVNILEHQYKIVLATSFLSLLSVFLNFHIERFVRFKIFFLFLQSNEYV